MTHNAWAGRRCWAVRAIVTPTGYIPAYTYGTLCRVINHEGQFSAIVAWDKAFTAAVPPSEIRIFPVRQRSGALLPAPGVRSRPLFSAGGGFGRLVAALWAGLDVLGSRRGISRRRPPYLPS
jgi:hypothetical protein